MLNGSVKQPKKRAPKRTFLPITSAIINNMEDGIPEERPRPILDSVSNFRINSTTVFLTFSQCPMPKEKAYEYLNANRPGSIYFVIGQETHVDGNFHLHMFIQYDKRVNTQNCKYFDMIDENGVVYHGNYQSARQPDAALDYCKKYDLLYLEKGLYMSMNQPEIQKRAQENKIKLSMSLTTMVDQGIIALKDLSQYQKSRSIYQLENTIINDKVPRVSVWIYGAAGSGKSLYIRNEFANSFYSKPLNKWWDAYQPTQRIVVLDDFSLTSSYLGEKLKIWADDYSFFSETKGATAKPNYGIFLTTSQYLPEDIWCPGFDQLKWDKSMQDAIERRFIICSINANQQLIVHQKPHLCNHWANHLNIGDLVDVKSIYIGKRDQFAAQEALDTVKVLAKTKEWFDVFLDK